MDNTVKACCKTPLVSTLKFSGAELFCIECRKSYGIFQVPEWLPDNDETEKQHTANTNAFWEVATDYVPPNSWRGGCDKCDERGQYHIDHLTEDEKTKSAAAYAWLMDSKRPLGVSDA